MLHGKTTTADLESNSQQINKPINLSLLIDKYIELVDDCVQYADEGTTPDMSAQVIQKAHHTVLTLGLYVDS